MSRPLLKDQFQITCVEIRFERYIKSLQLEGICHQLCIFDRTGESRPAFGAFIDGEDKCIT